MKKLVVTSTAVVNASLVIGCVTVYNFDGFLTQMSLNTSSLFAVRAEQQAGNSSFLAFLLVQYPMTAKQCIFICKIVAVSMIGNHFY